MALLAVAWRLVAGSASLLGAVPVVGLATVVVADLALLTLLMAGWQAALSPGQLPHGWWHWPGALATALGWTELQLSASAFIAHQVVHWTPIYGASPSSSSC